MADTRKVVKVFLASPGDLSDERRAAKDVVDEFNALFADEFGYQVELVGWEDTVSSFGRPQATINRDLERCELFLGLMWKRWGTPPDISGPYTSGFEEEFDISVSRRLREGRPEISLFLKDIDPVFLNDRGPELNKVLHFRETLIATKSIYFESFTSLRDFEIKIRRCITKYVRELKARDANEASSQSQAGPADDPQQQTIEEPRPAPETPFSVGGAEFLRGFISKIERDTAEEPIDASEVARFRLLSTVVGTTANDVRVLGVHDANLLYIQRMAFTFGHQELLGLFSCGLEHYVDENVPFWCWAAAIDGMVGPLPMYSIVGMSTERRVGALTAMRLISHPLDSSDVDRDDLVNLWFSDGTADDIKVAALRYLGDSGVIADLKAISQELEKRNSQTTGAAIEAFVRIKLRDSRRSGVLALYELAPSYIDKDLIFTLFANDAALDVELLRRGLGHKSAAVRCVTAERLVARGAMPEDTARQLLADSDPGVRLAALRSLVASGHTFSDAAAKEVLVKVAPPTGLRGALGGLPAADGEEYWKQFQQERLRMMKDSDLEAVVLKDSIFDRYARFVLTERQFAKRGDDLRRQVDDKYKLAFEKALSSMVERYGQDHNLIEQTKSLEDHLRSELTHNGLAIIYRKGDARDLGRVREALKRESTGYSVGIVDYLRKFGEWEDIEVIDDLVERSSWGGHSILSARPDSGKYRRAAGAIYAIGCNRLPELLAIRVSNRLFSYLIVEISNKAFHNLTDNSIMILLRKENDTIRKAAALKCVRALPKRRVTRLLADYLSADRYHYNVVHWLDLGVSAPTNRARVAAGKAIDMEWRESEGGALSL